MRKNREVIAAYYRSRMVGCLAIIIAAEMLWIAIQL